MRVLVAEDEQALAGYIAEGLRRQAMAVDLAHDGTLAIEKLATADYDVLVLDRDLPGTHGDDVCRQLTDEGSLTRVLMLTAMGDVRDRVAGLRLGADDYLAKPFDFDELTARIVALGRRSRPRSPRSAVRRHRAGHRNAPGPPGRPLPAAVQQGVRRAVRADGRPLHRGQRRGTAHRRLGRAHRPFTNAVRVTVCRLRAKLDDPGSSRPCPAWGTGCAGAGPVSAPPARPSTDSVCAPGSPCCTPGSSWWPAPSSSR
ncbi:response regulator transcription factor [Streptomyces sp. M19]